jgi:histone acetyltransferase 1
MAVSSYERFPSSPRPNTPQYSIAGYSTSYHFLAYKAKGIKLPLQTFTLPPDEPFSPASLPSRARISQFLILPSHQGHSHGTHLFKTITQTLLSTPTVWEITVEDPNEAFDDLRDYIDYTRLQANGTFSKIALSTDLPPTLATRRVGARVPTSRLLDLPRLESLRAKNKMAPRQFARLVEMNLLSRIPPEVRRRGAARLSQRGKTADGDDRVYYYWRLLVKQRVYKQNRDLLAQLDRPERIEKVEQTVGELVGDYERLLQGLADRTGNALEPEAAAEMEGDEKETENGNDSETKKVKEEDMRGRSEGVKRKIVSDTDGDPTGGEEVDDAHDADDEAARAPKRRREEASQSSYGHPPLE